jgi:hypothetical protein
VTTPCVDSKGDVLGTFPEQTPCLEHINSIYPDRGIECQTCHMPEAESSVIISNVGSGYEDRDPFSQHYFVGSNEFMLELLKANIDTLRITASSDNFDGTISRLMNLLNKETAVLLFSKTERSGDLLILDIDIEQLVGHKFPTGFPSRRAWLHLKVADKNGNVVFESGKPLKDGRIQGCDSDQDISTYEPHYDVIHQEDQVQVYEAVMLNSDGEVTYTLLRANKFAKDNRLLPKGFDIVNSHENTRVYGEALDDSNFMGGFDRITYQVDTNGTSGTLTVEVDLLMQTVSYPYIQDFSGENTPEATRFLGMYEEMDKSPTLVTSISTIVP